MESAIERLAAELMKLPAGDWERFAELRLATPQQAGFWQADEDELTERLAQDE